MNHGSYDDLERCLAHLVRQTQPPLGIAVYDTGEQPARLEAISLAHPEAEFELGPNRGFAGGGNRVVDRCIQGVEPLDFVLLVNPDVELGPDYARCLIEAMSERPRAAIGTGKLMRPDLVTLDSAGVVFPRHRRPRDRGSGKRDLGQFDESASVDAASGAAMMLRVAVLGELTIEGELFDEAFFAYHEDTDLCWRARLFGWEILYEPRALAVHRRGWRRAERDEVALVVRRHSFKNHYLQIVKNESLRGIVINLPWLLGWELLRLARVLLRDRALGAAYRDAWRALPAARRKRVLVQSRARSRSRPPAERS